MTWRLLPLLCLAALLAAPAPRAQLVADDPNGAAAGDSVQTSLPDRAFRRAPVRLVYDHVDQTVSLLDERGGTVEVWDRADGTPYADVPTDRPVVVEVANANALVYDYDVGATVVEPLEAPRQCGRQARSFVLAGALIAGQSLNPTTPLALDPGTGFEDFLGLDGLALGGVGTLLAGRRSDGALAASELEQIERESQTAVARLVALAERVTAVRSQTSDAVVRAARLGDAEPIGPLLEAVQTRLEAEASGLSDPARVPVVVADLAPPTDGLADLFATADALSSGAVDAADPADAADVLELAAAARAAAEVVATETAALQALALRVDRARDAVRQRATVRPGDDLREVAVIVSPAANAVAGVVPTRNGTVRAYLGPRPSRGFGCAVAVALAFAPRVPDYEVRDGALVDDRGDGLGTSPAVLFELAPPVVGPAFGLVGGIGLGSSDGLAPDLYAGGSLRLFHPVLLVGGAVWRRARALPDGFSVGDDVGSEDFDEAAFLDGLPRTWRPSFFVGLSVTP